MKTDYVKVANRLASVAFKVVFSANRLSTIANKLFGISIKLQCKTI